MKRDVGILREFRLEISSFVLVLGIVPTTLVIINFIFRPSLPSTVIDLLDAIGNWFIWLVVVGPLLALVGGWYFVDVLRKQREFERLIEVPSKSHFVRNRERLETLSWYLPAEYRRRYRDQKKRWKIKA
ncbi:MAG: DUF3198 domain-containing protein [Candidatus Thermoplasmatota archaeon]|nr:DUF3198 domain-containing protein [Candidatus Thermoplasmatota archaeon]